MSERPEDQPPPNSAVRESMGEAAGARPVADETPTIDTDAALLAAYAAGDAEAFAQLYERHARATWRFIRHRLGPANEAAADGVLEDGWIAVALQAPHLPGSARWTPWLYALVRRHVLARLAAPGVAADEPPPAEPLPPEPDPKAQARAFLAGLARLPAEPREAAVLHLEAGLDEAGIAAITGEPIGEVGLLLQGALARLAELVEPQEGDTGLARVARAYAQAWALRDASSRGPSVHARDVALATARAVVAQRRDEAARREAQAPALDADPQLDFVDAVHAGLQSALLGDAPRAVAPQHARPVPDAVAPQRARPVPDAIAPQRARPVPDAVADAPEAAREPVPLADEADVVRATAPPGARRPAAANRPSLTQRVAVAAGVALVAGVAGWQVRDRLGPNLVGAVFELPSEPTSTGGGPEQSRRRLDEALARAEAALARASASAPAAAVADTTASPAAPAAPVAAASTAPIAAPASAVALAGMSEPETAPASAAATSSAPAPAPRPAEAGPETSRVATAAPAPRASAHARPAARRQAPAFDPADAIAGAQARSNAFLGKPGAVPARPATAGAHAAKRSSGDARAAVEAAQARADAFLAGAGVSSPSR